MQLYSCAQGGTVSWNVTGMRWWLTILHVLMATLVHARTARAQIAINNVNSANYGTVSFYPGTPGQNWELSMGMRDVKRVHSHGHSFTLPHKSRRRCSTWFIKYKQRNCHRVHNHGGRYRENWSLWGPSLKGGVTASHWHCAQARGRKFRAANVRCSLNPE